jgi:hypothetical protein
MDVIPLFAGIVHKEGKTDQELAITCGLIDETGNLAYCAHMYQISHSWLSCASQQNYSNWK